MTSYRGDYKGLGQIMCSAEMQELVRQAGLGAMSFAVGIAPVGTPPRDKHPGEYKASFELQVSERGGPKKDRAEAVLVNTADYAADVEWPDGHLVLTRTVAYLASG